MKMCIKFEPNKSSQLALNTHYYIYVFNYSELILVRPVQLISVRPVQLIVRPVQFIPASLFNWPLLLQPCYTVDIVMLLYFLLRECPLLIYTPDLIFIFVI
jgi:hypothetical protein